MIATARSSPLRTQFQTLARYNVWATRRLLDEHVAKLSDDEYRRDCGLFFESVHGTLNHLLVGEHHLWFRRFADGSSPQVRLDAEVEPDRVRLASALVSGAGRWLPLIGSWPDERFDGAIEYVRMNGQRMRLPFAATLAHVFNHGTHHRGQITAAITMLGRPAAELDLAYMLQQEIASP